MTPETVAVAPPVPLLIDGKRIRSSADRLVAVHNPSTGEIIGQTPLCEMGEVDQAVQAAGRAFRDWSRVPVLKRAAVMFRYRDILEEHFEELSTLVTRENGKTREEARGDVRRGMEVVEFACGIGQTLKAESLPRLAEHIDALARREPIGVCAGITPFNFPAMVPLWMFPLAIACGNTFVLKPSPKTPLTAVRLGELLAEAGLPEGVFNIVHGDREAARAICEHPGISAVSFVGSTPAARSVYETACRHGKRVQAAGGAKNVMVVMPDAEPDSTIRGIMGAAFGCAGQRCMAGSVAMLVGDAADVVRDRLLGAADRLLVADTGANPAAEMGPVIDEQARERVRCAIDDASVAGARIARDGRINVPEAGFFVGPTLVDEVHPDIPIFGQEVFGPVLSMARPSSLDEAVAWMRRSPYGNGATIFTSSGAHAQRFIEEAPCGMLGVNVGVPAPMALFPFSGWNDSFFGDLHIQGTEGVQFYTRQKVVLSRWDGAYERRQGW